MNVLWASPSEDLIATVADHLVASGKDYSANLVVFPGKRPAHFLRKILAEREKSSFIPPSILSMDEFIDHLFCESLGLGRRKIEALDAIAILYEIHTSSAKPLGLPGFLSPDRFFPVGMKIYQDLEELCIEGIPAQKVRMVDTIVEGNIPDPTVRRLQSLSYFYETFYQKIERGNLSTRSTRYRTVSANMARFDLGRFRIVILAGFFALTASEREIFRSLMKRENALLIFQEGEGLGQRLSDLGILVPPRSCLTQPEIHCYQSPDTHGQALGVSSLLREILDKDVRLDENTVIVLPSPESLFPLLHQALSLLDPEAYNISLGYPLQRTPLFGFFNNLMDVVTSMDGDRLYVPHYLELVLHPYTKNIYFKGRTDITRVLFHTIEEILTEKKAKKFLTLMELERDEGLIRSVSERISSVGPDTSLNELREHLESIHKNTLRKMLSFENVGDFARKLKEVIEYIYHNSTARLHPFFYPYSQSFLMQVDLLSKSLMKEMSFQDKASYFTLFRRLIQSSYTPFAGTPLRGVQVLGLLETRNLRFDRVIFLDVNEGILPNTEREDSLLPFKARQSLGLPTHRDREAIISYTFETLIGGAREVHLFYVENAEKERSRFVEKLLWEKQKRERNRESKSYVKTIRYQINLRKEDPKPLEKSPEVVKLLRQFTFSATSLDTYLDCPLEFYYAYVLGLREKEVVSEEIEREEIGSFVHRVLYEYLKGKMGCLLSEKDLDLREFDKILRKQFETLYGEDPIGETFLLKRQVERHLREFITNYQLPKIKEVPTEILGLEQRIDAIKESFRLRARLDRIERRGKRIAIIDYKTSANKNSLALSWHRLDPSDQSSWRKAIGTLQLPFYLLTYSSFSGERPDHIDCLFLLLGRMRIGPEIELPLFKDEEEFQEHFETMTRVVLGLLSEIVDPEKPFVPTTDRKSVCSRCAYGHLCTNQDESGS